MELKESDFKLLNYLYHNYREPLTKIAKEAKLSRQQVEYKLKRYLDEGLIKKFMTIFNLSAFGYSKYAILFVKFTKLSGISKFNEFIKNSKNKIQQGKVIGEYDVFVEMVFENEGKLNEFVFEMLKKNSDEIVEYKIINPFFSKLYPLKFFDDKQAESFEIVSSDFKEISLKEIDKKLLKILEKNARARIIDIASELNISAELVLHKLKKLKKQGIILGNRIAFDNKKLGYFYSLILINIKKFSLENQEKLKQFAANSKNINSIMLNRELPNCILQVFDKNQNELIKKIEELRELFKEENVDIKIMFVKDEGEVNTLPFF